MNDNMSMNTANTPQMLQKMKELGAQHPKHNNGRFRSDNPDEIYWQSSSSNQQDLLRDATPYRDNYNQMAAGDDDANANGNGNGMMMWDATSPNDGGGAYYDTSVHDVHYDDNEQYVDDNADGYNTQMAPSPQFVMQDYGDVDLDDGNQFNGAQNQNGYGGGGGNDGGNQKWSRRYNKQNLYNAQPSYGRGRGRGRGMQFKRGGGGYRGHGGRGYGRGGHRGNRGGGHVANRRGGGFRGGGGARGNRGNRRGGGGTRGRGSRGGRGGSQRKATTKEDLDRDLDKYLYGGDDGAERQKGDLDNDLDSYWNTTNDAMTAQATEDQNKDEKQEVLSTNEKQEADADDVDQKKTVHAETTDNSDSK